MAGKLGIELPISIDQRMAGAEKVGAHKTSMLQDLEAGRPMELEAVVGAVVELAERLGRADTDDAGRVRVRKMLEAKRSAARAPRRAARPGIATSQCQGSGRESTRSVTINNRWFQLCASLVAMIMIANLQYSWTLFVEPCARRQAGNCPTSSGRSRSSSCSRRGCSRAQGFLIDRMGPRVFTTLAGVLCGIGWTGLGLVTTLPMLYTLYVIAGIGAALIYGGCIGSALKWFTKERGFAAGMMAAGFGGGTALFMPVIASIIRTRGYQAAFIYTGVFQAIVILDRRAVPPASRRATRQSRRRLARSSASISSRPRDAPHAAVLVLYVSFVMMATGGLLVTANAGSMPGPGAFRSRPWPRRRR